ncbi:MAG TPA: YtxH domain-containing protein, partial [Microlunatus sp.]|nr:YtxH domain-containing protein [Microlunatus sp.]
DGTAMKMVQESTMLEMDTAPIYNTAANRTGTSPADLRTRTEIAAVPDSQLITVTVTADSADEAVAQANAIADAAINVNQRRIDTELEQLTDNTRDLIVNSRLSNADAEQARVSRLGDTLGQNQSNLVVGSRNVVLVHSAEAASLLPSPGLLGALGLVAGALIGGVIALLLGSRRGKVHSTRELRQLYPNASVVDPLDLESVITLESQNASVVYVAGLHQTPEHLQTVADAVRTQFLANGREVEGRETNRGVKLDERPLQVITTTLSDTVLRRIAHESNSLLIIPVQPKVTRMEELDAYASRLNDRTYLLVDHRTTSGWN